MKKPSIIERLITNNPRLRAVHGGLMAVVVVALALTHAAGPMFTAARKFPREVRLGTTRVAVNTARRAQLNAYFAAGYELRSVQAFEG